MQELITIDNDEKTEGKRGIKRKRKRDANGPAAKKKFHREDTKSLIDTILADEFLGDEHMTIAHELLHAQYPHLGGLQPTIFSQNNGFCPVKSTVDSIQIHYTGHSHWVVYEECGQNMYL